MVYIMGVPSFFEFHPPPLLQTADVLQRPVQQARKPISRPSSQDEPKDQLSLSSPSEHSDETFCHREQKSQTPESTLSPSKQWTAFHRRLPIPIRGREADTACFLPSGDTIPPTIEYSNSEPNCTRRNPKPQSPNTFPATHIFQECARLLTNPFADEFDLNPHILNAPRPLISRTEKFQLKVLDVGYNSTSQYTKSIATLQHTRVYKIIPQMSTMASEATENDGLVYTLPIRSLGSLPIKSGSFDIISARTLYTDVTKFQRHSDMQGEAQRSLKSWVGEFYRVLNKGGCLEYIFFDRGLSNTGPLTENLESLFYDQTNYLHDDSMADHNARQDAYLKCNPLQNYVTGDQFLNMLQSEGFTIEQNISLMFPLSTLSSLFTQDGQQRNRGRFVLDDTAAPEIASLLQKVYKECSEMDSAWRVYIGYARKMTG